MKKIMHQRKQLNNPETLTQSVDFERKVAEPSVLEYLEIDPKQIKAIKPHSRRIHYKAIVNWLTRYQPDAQTSTLEQFRGILETFYHFCVIQEWQKAADIIVGVAVVKTSVKTLASKTTSSSSEQFHVQLGTCGNYSEQIDIYKILLNKLTPEINLICLNGLGLAHHSLGNWKKALQFHQMQLAIAQKTEDMESQKNALNNLGNVYGSLHQCKQAIACYDQALEIARQEGDSKGEGKTLGNLGVIYRFLNDRDQSIEYFLKSLEVGENLEDSQLIQNAQYNLGIDFYLLGEYSLALDYFSSSLISAAKVGDVKGEAVALGSIGNVYCAMNNHSEALKYHQQHLALSREIGHLEGESKALGNLGVIYHCIGNYEKALEYYNQKKALVKQLGDRQSEAYMLTNIGNTYAYIGKPDVAINFHQKSLNLATEIEDVLGVASALHNIGDAYRLLQKFDEAVFQVIQSLYIFDSINSPQVQVALTTLRKIALEVGVEQYNKLVEKHLILFDENEVGKEMILRLQELLYETP